jgi:hypothetical protein
MMRAVLFGSFVLALLLSNCSERQHRNPLDPLALQSVEGTLRELQALAGDGEVVLTWDYTYFDDIAGLHLYRRVGDGPFARHPAELLPPEIREFVDRQVENGTTYEYRLGMVINGEGEQLLEGAELSTPGREVAWVADRQAGLVWKIGADGRRAHFAQGRFPSLEGMALDLEDGSCWVTDRFFPGVYRISPDGELEPHRADIARGGNLAIDVEGRRAWVVDAERQEVRWFALPIQGDSLNLGKIDAVFAAPGGLAPQEGGCWIADAEAGRVLYIHPDGERVEFRGLDRPANLTSARGGGVWALVEGGQTLMRLDRDGGEMAIVLPFADGQGMVEDGRTGQVWVLGRSDIAIIGAGGEIQGRWDGLEEGVGLDIDEAQEQLWIATRGFLWKFNLSGQTLARLGGFSGLLKVAVDPGEER